MKMMRTLIGLVVLIALAGGVWVLRFHTDWIQPKAAEEGDEGSHDSVVPVHVAKIS